MKDVMTEVMEILFDGITAVGMMVILLETLKKGAIAKIAGSLAWWIFG